MHSKKKIKLVPWNKYTANFGCILIHKLTEEKFILRGVKGYAMYVDHEEITSEQLFANYWSFDKNSHKIRACAEEVIIYDEKPKVKTIFNKIFTFLTRKE